MKKIFCTFIAVLALTACSSKYRVDDVQKATQAVSLNSHFYVMQVMDGQFEAQTYSGSGNMASSSVANVLISKGGQVTKASNIQTFDEALTQARSSSADYLLQTNIQHWEDRATEWSGRPDRITMKYSLYSCTDGQQVSSMIVSASSKWMTLGGDHPQDLVPETVQSFLNQAF